MVVGSVSRETTSAGANELAVLAVACDSELWVRWPMFHVEHLRPSQFVFGPIAGDNTWRKLKRYGATRLRCRLQVHRRWQENISPAAAQRVSDTED